MSLVELIQIISRRRILAAITFSCIAAITIITYTLSARQYTSEALLVVGQDSGRPRDESSATSSALTSLAQIALTTNVIREATEQVGLERVLPNLSHSENPLKRAVRHAADWVGAGDYLPKHDSSQSWPRIAEAIRLGLRAKAEDKSNVLSISFRNRNQEVAAEFVNALCAALIRAQSELMSRSRLVTIFDKRLDALNKQAATSAKLLAEYMSKNATYSIETQQTLLLNRASELSNSLSESRTSIADRQGQKKTLVDQLRRLKPVSQSTFVSGLVDNLGGESGSDADSRRAAAESRSSSGEPPLLLVRVYQDGMANLLKINAELSGLESRQSALAKELKSVNDSLSELSKKQAEFEHLKRGTALSATDVEVYRKQILDEQVSADLLTARVANLRVAQEGVPSTDPSYPRPLIFLPLGVLAALMGAIAAAFLREILSRRTPVDIDPEPRARWTLQAVPGLPAPRRSSM